jgi:hypothetical protein
MAATKKATSPQSRPLVPPRLAKTVRWFLGPGRTLGFIVLLAVVFGGGWSLVWRSVRADVLSSAAYRLTPDSVEITPVPEWIHKQEKDICREVFRDASLDPPLSILDDGLVEKVRSALALNPWVAKVRSVRKYHPAQVKVDLVYRQPVCVVQIGTERHPVDVDGILLPSEDLSVTEAALYPRLVGIEMRPGTPLGSRWNDPRVAGAAEIAHAFGPAWVTLALETIVPVPQSGADRSGNCTYELLTRGGTRVSWGRAPSSAYPGEPSPSEKVGKLQEYFKSHGTLEGTQGPQQLDLTRPGGWRVTGDGCDYHAPPATHHPPRSSFPAGSSSGRSLISSRTIWQLRGASTPIRTVF